MDNLKVALISANIGGYDAVRPGVAQNYKVDSYYVTDRSMCVPLPHLNNRLRGKYFKTQTHHVLAGYDVLIWHDASVEITSPDLVRTLVNALPGYDVVIPRHPDRATVWEEFDYLTAHMETSDYLRARYLGEPFKQERDFYEAQDLPADTPLYACRLFARWCTPAINAAFDEWWRRCLEFSNFDQTQFSYIAWRHQLRIPITAYQDLTDSFVSVHKHL